jgi:type IV pilus assembly protein PilB
MNWVSGQRLEDIVRRQKRKMLTGEILVARGLVTERDVAAALEAQKKNGGRAKRIGEMLVEMGLIEERHVIEALSEKFSIRVLDPDISQIDCELGRRISLKYLRRQTALPIGLEDGEMHLLVADPTNNAFFEEIARLFNCRVRLSLASSPVILQTLGLVDSLLQSKDAGIADYQKVKYHSLETQSQPQAGDDRIVQMVDQLIRSAIEEGASDVHLEPLANKLRVRYRIDGVLVHKMDFPREYTPRIVSRIKILADADVAERRKHQDGRIFVKTEKQEIDIRVSFYATDRKSVV